MDTDEIIFINQGIFGNMQSSFVSFHCYQYASFVYLMDILGQNSFSFVMSTGSKAMEGNQEFQIQNEDFPALPGAPSQQIQGDGVLPTTQLGAITQPAIQNHIGQHLENKDAVGDNYSYVLFFTFCDIHSVLLGEIVSILAS